MKGPPPDHPAPGASPQSIGSSDRTAEPGQSRHGFAVRLVPFLAFLFIRLLWATMRVRHVDREPLDRIEKEGRNYILAFWHGQLLMMTYAYRGSRMCALISQHGDGEYIARTMAWFGHTAIRGSTTRGGAAALRSVVRALRRGMDIGFTPDGPRGPRFKVQGGIILAARLGRVPIVPVSFSVSRARFLRSWDRFLVPLPFSRGTMLYGRPMDVPAGATDEQMEALRRQLERQMQSLVAVGDGQPEPPSGDDPCA